MLRILRARLKQGYRTIRFPDQPPVLPEQYRGRPQWDAGKCTGDVQGLCSGLPYRSPEQIERCRDHGLGPVPVLHELHGTLALPRPSSSPRSIVWRPAPLRSRCSWTIVLTHWPRPSRRKPASSSAARLSCGKSVPAAATPVSGYERLTPSDSTWAVRLQFVASPGHADGLLVTGPVTKNMELASKDLRCQPATGVIVIASGTCAISGGPYIGHPEVHNGTASVVPVDLFIPGCPPHPLTLLDGLLRLLGRIE